MTTDEMDADLSTYTSADQLSQRLGYWERRLNLSKPTKAELQEFGELARKHALRVAAVMRAG
jgi:hypothetical protein